MPTAKAKLAIDSSDYAEVCYCFAMGGFRFIDLFAGCGGLSLGLTNAGWTGVFAVEKNSDAFETLKHNLCGKGKRKFEWPEWLPCKELSTSDLLLDYREKLESLRGKIDLIAGGPPCQGFSFAGRRNPDDPRNQLMEEYIAIVDIVRPKFLLFENVRGFTAAFKNSDRLPHAAVIKEKLEGLSWGGYQVSCRLVNASIFGVPQPRARFILLAIRQDAQAEFLNSVAFDPFENLESSAENFRKARNLHSHEISVSEAISDLEIGKFPLIDCPETLGFKQIDYVQPEKPTSFQALMRKGSKRAARPNSLRLPKHKTATVARFQDVLETCAKGKSLSVENRERYKTKKQCFTPLHPDQLSKTITTLPDDLLHYSEPRILTVRENARLQSFPDWFAFRGKYTTGGARRREECPRYTQVGNAVPPLMGEALGELIKEIAI
jgi:DNA (cytosine-5)-methyltransferase 1